MTLGTLYSRLLDGTRPRRHRSCPLKSTLTKSPAYPVYTIKFGSHHRYYLLPSPVSTLYESSILTVQKYVPTSTPLCCSTVLGVCEKTKTSDHCPPREKDCTLSDLSSCPVPEYSGQEMYYYHSKETP